MSNQIHVYDISERDGDGWPTNQPWWNPEPMSGDAAFWNNDGFGWLYLEIDGLKLRQPVSVAIARKWVDANIQHNKQRFHELLDQMEKNTSLYLRRKST